jgi:hypothetical protein
VHATLRIRMQPSEEDQPDEARPGILNAYSRWWRPPKQKALPACLWITQQFAVLLLKPPPGAAAVNIINT